MYRIDYDFSSITNGTEAYILGFIYADGFIIDSPHNKLGITLAVKDKSLLEKIRNYISKDIPIRHEHKTFENVRFVLCRKQVIENLKKWGLHQGKTKIDFEFPHIDPSLYSHFIRGFFDGDGSIIRDRKYIKFFICSPLPKILEDMKIIFEENQISCKLRVDRRKGKPFGKNNSLVKGVANYDQYRLIVDKNVFQRKLYNFLYRDAEIFLERKKELFERCFINVKRKSVDRDYITIDGVTKSFEEWTTESNVSKKMFYSRINHCEWSIEDALSYKKGENNKNFIAHLKKGEDHPNSKLSKEQVINIFFSNKSYKVLAKEYNVHWDTIRKIKTRVNYKCITDKLLNNNTDLKNENTNTRIN